MGADIGGGDVVPGEGDEHGGQRGWSAADLDLSVRQDVGAGQRLPPHMAAEVGVAGQSQRVPRPGGPSGEVAGPAGGDHGAAVDDREPVAQVLGLVHVVRDQHDRDAAGGTWSIRSQVARRARGPARW